MPVLAVALLFPFFPTQVKLSDETGMIARGEAVWDDGEGQIMPIDSGVGAGRLAVTSSDSAPGRV